MSNLPTESSFLKDVANHEMTIVRDDGVYRHVRFKQPSTSNMYFDLVTWPGYLAFSGDMGCYCFKRLHDMFEFFRSDYPAHMMGGKTLHINPQYWGQKLEAVDRCSGLKEYSKELFRSAVMDYLKSHYDDEPIPADLMEAVEDEVLSMADEGEHEAMKAAIEFRHGKFYFSDFWEYSVREYTWRFMWCCYSLAWAVKQYDERPVAVECVAVN